MTYEQILAKQPPTTMNGDRVAAQSFVDLLTMEIQGAGTSGLTKSQQNYLYKLRAKWTVRADGKDANWNTHGSTPGRKRVPLANPSAPHLDPTVWGDDDDVDPLLASISRKFGVPRRTDNI